MSRAVSLAVEKRDRCHEPIHLIGFRKNRHTGSLSIYCGAMSAIGQSGHPWLHCTCLLSGVKRTWVGELCMSAYGPMRTFISRRYCVSQCQIFATTLTLSA